ncbi:hypothetical protein NQ318_019968 [Aromia moschata]|uniref:Defensin n=1 Tax=Aromia moschata TaxID=1265417 RepID=A0AAV8Y6G2_9CUCU|nr:hypothetical protein NQ318_019968 [Aromia moschata]
MAVLKKTVTATTLDEINLSVSTDTGCNVIPCSEYCRHIGHFGGYCDGPNKESCHCYDVGQGKS